MYADANHTNFIIKSNGSDAVIYNFEFADDWDVDDLTSKIEHADEQSRDDLK